MKKTIIPIAFVIFFQIAVFAQSDASLGLVTEKDAASRDAQGKLISLAAEEHLYRGDVYMANRLFPQAREHFQKFMENFPTDPGMSRAIFGMARSLMWERKYQEAINWFDKLSPDYLGTKEGREGTAFKGACYVRLSKPNEAVKVYEQYTIMFPTGEKIDSAHLNIIDALREAGRYAEANVWVEKTRVRFSGMPVETNALHARLRMELFRQNWNEVVKAADDLLLLNRFSGSMVGFDETRFLRAYGLEKAGRRAEAVTAYRTIPDSISSYYGGLSTERLAKLDPGSQVKKTVSVSAKNFTDFPVLYRTELLRNAKLRNVDPRFVLAIMKQESSFRPGAKSPAAARGLLQLVFDTAIKYSKLTGYPALKPDDLYDPATNIAIGSYYIGELKNEFGGMYEAIAASYNGGEDNALRWLGRTKPKEAAIFASEVGFAETKNYVFKVMSNYRVYRELYKEDLTRRQ
ncbi:MAG: transglycosylase SLT domain-containing protein [Acidobacteria bacterium]|nr:transglycosylase SLT domain-containing protein [Acidobacteriota bacterium]